MNSWNKVYWYPCATKVGCIYQFSFTFAAPHELMGIRLEDDKNHFRHISLGFICRLWRYNRPIRHHDISISRLYRSPQTPILVFINILPQSRPINLPADGYKRALLITPWCMVYYFHCRKFARHPKHEPTSCCVLYCTLSDAIFRHPQQGRSLYRVQV